MYCGHCSSWMASSSPTTSEGLRAQCKSRVKSPCSKASPAAQEPPAPAAGRGHSRSKTALPPWGWCRPCSGTLLAKSVCSYSLHTSWHALGSHDVIFSKPACRRTCLHSFRVGRREGEELLGRTDFISTLQSTRRDPFQLPPELSPGPPGLWNPSEFKRTLWGSQRD